MQQWVVSCQLFAVLFLVLCRFILSADHLVKAAFQALLIHVLNYGKANCIDKLNWTSSFKGRFFLMSAFFFFLLVIVEGRCDSAIDRINVKLTQFIYKFYRIYRATKAAKLRIVNRVVQCKHLNVDVLRNRIHSGLLLKTNKRCSVVLKFSGPPFLSSYAICC